MNSARADSTTADWLAVDEYVAAFEAASSVRGNRDWSEFLPPLGDPLRLVVLCELARIDMEASFDQGKPRRLETYRDRFPELFGDRESTGRLAFEEYRLLRRTGGRPSLAEYQDRYGIDGRDWPVGEIPPPVDSRAKERAAHSQFRVDTDGAHPITKRWSTSDDARLPSVGTNFRGFDLLAELGRGAFARVFLARQGELADRRVALKISVGQSLEPQSLARLQHANIVPIHSIHHDGVLQAVCMPYFGQTTLADLLRGEKRPEDGVRSKGAKPIGIDECVSPLADSPKSVLRLFAGLAEGLKHAHSRGIEHRDLKPANVLVTDEGLPMLLDFNLSADAASPEKAVLGGTLPYMAPEQLRAFQGHSTRVDGRADLYALGVMLFQCLTGELPFPTRRASGDSIPPEILLDRESPLVWPRETSKAITPAIRSIVARLLAPLPEKRYASAEQVVEDLNRQLDHRPLAHASDRSPIERLAKWRRRHPKLTSATSVTILAAVLLAGVSALFAARQSRLERLEGAERLRTFETNLNTIRSIYLGGELDSPAIERADRLVQENLDAYGLDPSELGDSPAPLVGALNVDERQRFDQGVTEMLLLWSRRAIQASRATDEKSPRDPWLERAAEANAAIGAFRADRSAPRAALAQRVELASLTGVDHDPEAALLAEIESSVPASAPDFYLLATEQYGKGDYQAAARSLAEAARLAPQDFSIWRLWGHCEMRLGAFSEAVSLYSTCVALAPRSRWSWFDRGLARLEAKEYRGARDDFDRTLELSPEDALDEAEIYSNRGLARRGLEDHSGAIDDFTKAIELGARGTRLYFMRARVRDFAGDSAGASQDRAAGMEAPPLDEKDWVVRGLDRLPENPLLALEEFERALAVRPGYRAALEDKAHVLSEYLGRVEDAIGSLDLAIRLYPGYVAARSGRGVLLARLGKRELALADAREALLLDSSPAIQYQVAGIYALGAKDHPENRLEALRLLASAFRAGFGRDLVDRDPDLAPLRDDAEFQRLVEATRSLWSP